MENACSNFSLVFPNWSWLPWLIAGIGVAVAVFALLRNRGTSSDGDIEISPKEGKISIRGGAFLIGLLLFVVGLFIGAIDYHPPFARWVGDKFPSFVSEADVEIKGDFHDEKLKNIVSTANAGGRYSIRLAPKADNVAITGDFEALCGADLIDKICKKEGQKLFCDVDADNRIIRICTKDDVTPCKDRIF
jgi:hypothetical protein